MITNIETQTKQVMSLLSEARGDLSIPAAIVEASRVGKWQPDAGLSDRIHLLAHDLPDFGALMLSELDYAHETAMAKLAGVADEVGQDSVRWAVLTRQQRDVVLDTFHSYPTSPEDAFTMREGSDRHGAVVFLDVWLRDGVLRVLSIDHATGSSVITIHTLGQDGKVRIDRFLTVMECMQAIKSRTAA